MAESDRQELIKLRRLAELERRANILSGVPASPGFVQAQEEKAREAEKPSLLTQARGTPAGRVVEGFVDLPLGAAQFVSESLGVEAVTEILKKREASIAEGRAAFDRGEDQGFDAFRLGGNLALGVLAARGLKLPSTFIGKVFQGLGIGAVTGAATPVTEGDVSEEKAAQIGIGASTGGIVPAAAGLVKAGVRSARALLPGGATANVRRLATEAVEGETAPVARELRAGGIPEQAIGRSGEPTLAALARGAQRRAPRETVRRTAEENTARVRTVREAGGGSADVPLSETIDSATRARASRTNPLFEAASKSTATVNTSRTSQLITRMIESDPNNQKLVPVLNQIQQTLEGGSAREVISASRNIGRLMSEKGPTGAPVNENIVRQLNIVKKALDKQIGRAVPEFKEANELFQTLSRPVNRAQVAQRLEQRLTAPLAGDESSVIQQRGAQFTAALDDERKLIAQSTGFKRGTGLDQFFDEDELVKLGNVADRLKADAEFQRLATLGTPEAKRLIAGLEPPKPIGMLDRTIVIIKGILTKAGAATEEATLKRASEIFADPQALANLLDGADARTVTALKRVINAIPFEDLARTAPAITATRQQ